MSEIKKISYLCKEILNPNQKTIYETDHFNHCCHSTMHRSLHQ